MVKSKTLRYWHRLAATLVGIQLMIWLATGLYFNLTPHDQLKGMTYRCGHGMAMAPPPDWSALSLAEPAQLLSRYPDTELVVLSELAGKPYYRLVHQRQRYAHLCQQHTLVDAQTGGVATIDEAMALQLAEASYMGPGTAVTAMKVDGADSEWPKQCNRLWRVDFDDDLATRVYLNAVSGELIGHKNDHTLVADWMFRLHFLDYLNRGSFNNPFAWLVALLSLGLLATSLVLLADNWRHGRYFGRHSSQRAKRAI